MLSAIRFNLNLSKILLSGNGLKQKLMDFIDSSSYDGLLDMMHNGSALSLLWQEHGLPTFTMFLRLVQN